MKTEQLQIRVTPVQKAALKRRAARAGLDVSAYVLGLALPAASLRFEEAIADLRNESDQRFALAALADLLVDLTPADLRELPAPDLSALQPDTRCRVAAMVEHVAVQAGGLPPRWVAAEGPLETPQFAAPFKALRLHLLQASPVAFRRRNLFVDSTPLDRA